MVLVHILFQFLCSFVVTITIRLYRQYKHHMYVSSFTLYIPWLYIHLYIYILWVFGAFQSLSVFFLIGVSF